MPQHEQIIVEIHEQWRQRQAWHRAEKAITLQAKALCRRLCDGDKGEAKKLYAAITKDGDHPLLDYGTAAISPLLMGRKPIEDARKAIEKRLETLAQQSPVAEWAKPVRGLGLLSIAAIIGEAGDLSNYPKKGHLWKRMGLALMPDGTRQRRIAGDKAIEHGYSPSRRSVMWTIGDVMVKVGDTYRQIYLDRKEYERERLPDAKPIVLHRRAQRYMEKRLLRDLWKAWREAVPHMPERASVSVPRADDLRVAA
jgi:hypothetical protein